MQSIPTRFQDPGTINGKVDYLFFYCRWIGEPVWVYGAMSEAHNDAPSMVDCPGNYLKLSAV